MNLCISQLKARAVLDSLGVPALEAEVTLSDGSSAAASVPSSTSCFGCGEFEHRGDSSPRFQSKGIDKAAAVINDQLADELAGFPIGEQALFDGRLIELDGTPAKKHFGTGTLFAVSAAYCKAAAQSLKVPLYRYLGGVCARLLPIPAVTLLSGVFGSEQGNRPIEFMVMPIGFSHYSEGLKAVCETFFQLREIFRKQGKQVLTGETGGIFTCLASVQNGLELIASASAAAGYKPGTDLVFALDLAAEHHYNRGFYCYEGKNCTAGETADHIAAWVNDFPIVSLENPCASSDLDGWKLITKKFGASIQIAGGNFFAGTAKHAARGITEGGANAVLIKPNQIGTVTETIDAVQLVQRNGFGVLISGRNGETEETFIADLAVGLNTGQIRAGGITRTERVCKYNRLLRIEEELDSTAVYSGAVMRK